MPSQLRRVISTAKLVVNISAAIAATFVAGILQATPATHWDHAAGLLMIATLVLTFWVVALRPKSHDKLQDPEAFARIERQMFKAHWLMVAQLGFSFAACLVSGLGLLWPCSWQ